MLTLLALALPMQTAAHTDTSDLGFERRTPQLTRRGHDEVPNPLPGEMINWIRVYKNPLIVDPVAQPQDLPRLGRLAFTPAEHPGSPSVYNFASLGFQRRNTYLMPSYDQERGQDIYWVKWDPASGDLFEDPAQEGNSGLVTATTHTSVGIGDIIAIAVNVTSWGGVCQADLALGERRWRNVPLTTGNPPNTRSFDGSRYEREWRLNANQPLWHSHHYGGGVYSVTPVSEAPTQQGTTHTLVYQFKVEERHVKLNGLTPWLSLWWVPYGEEQEITDWIVGTNWATNWKDSVDLYGDTTWRRSNSRSEVWGRGHVIRQWAAFDWVWGEDRDFRPPPTTVSPFNCFRLSARELLHDNMLGTYTQGNHPWSYVNPNAQIIARTDATTAKYQYLHPRDDSTPHRYPRTRLARHRHVPMYDPAAPGKEDIFYPKIEAPGSRANVEIRDVPRGTQTGEFGVSLHFVEDGVVFEGHDLSDAGVAAFKTKLDAALADWTVMSLEVLDEHRPTIASSGAVVTSHSESTRYELTLAPPEGVIDTFPLQIPEKMVFDAGGNGNFASAEVMISVDSSLTRGLPLAEGEAVEVVEPEAGAYRADDVIEVLVPFAEDGLTYEGTEMPYITIYLGEQTAENARHATWEKGTESAGSTIVPFRYVVHEDDPTVDSVRVDAAVLRPKGTTLMNGAGQVWAEGTSDPPAESGKKPKDAPPAGAGLSILTDTSAPLPEIEVPVTVEPRPPVLWLPPDESAPKAGLSSVPRTPLVFNELGNGSGDTNDWLELRNVTGDVVSLKEWELSVVQDGKKEDTSLVIFPDVSVPADGLLLLTNSDPTADGNLLAGGDDIATSTVENKGSSHLYLVQSGLSLPDDGQFLLILRKAKEKLGLNEAFVDVAGGGGSGTDAFVREQEGAYDTYVWPLQVLESPGGDTEDSLSSGKVWLRAKADIVGYHRDAWGEAAFTGVGYDRQVSKSAETAGTPGYPNGAVKTEAPTPRGAITISEVMLDSAGGTLPQWIELYNASKTDALNLNRWELEIQNVDSEDLVGRPIVRLTLQEKVIQPNQTLLIVTGNARASSENVFPEDRVYNLLELHDKNLRIKKPSDTFLSAMGFYLRLTDRNEHLVDEVGNTDGNRRTDDTPAWALPIPLSGVEGMRSSLVRRYTDGVAVDGTSRQGWALAANFARFKADGLHYGHADDIGTPGYRQGGALPVELSSFSVTRLESGSVIVTWTTESEVDNAGFNLRRSLTRENGFTLLNPALIAGAGTTGERQTYTFIDTSAKPGVEHYYQLEEVSFGGKPETLVTRRLRGPVSASHRALKTLGEVKQREE